MKRFIAEISLVSVLLALACCVSHASDIVIDDFSEPADFTITGPQDVTVTRTDIGLSSVIGGTRRVDFTQHGVDGDSQNLAHISSFYLSLSNSPNGYSDISTLYDNGGLGLGVDFSGTEHIAVFWRPDHLGLGRNNLMSITLKDSMDNSATQSYIWDTYWPNTGNIDLTTQFAISGFTGLDVSSIESLQFNFESDYSNHVMFYNITGTAVPEPVSSALFVLGGALIAVRRFRKHRKK